MSWSAVRKPLFAATALIAALQTLGAAPTPDGLFAEYRRRLAAFTPPPYVVFSYAEVRSGPTRVIAEEHEVYRAGVLERNATLSINGTKVVPPSVSVTRSGGFPYGVEKFAVDPAEYDLTYGGRTTVAGKRVYAFAAKRRTPGAFAVDGLYLDVHELLPVRETFTARSGACAGAGSIDFGRVGKYWLVNAVRVTCSVAGAGAGVTGPTFRESLRFSSYRFPSAIPPQVFGGAAPAAPASAVPSPLNPGT